MEFGKVQQIDNIDFALPADDPVTEQLWQRLALLPRQTLQVYIGGTEWGRTSWLGKAYPLGTKPKDFLTWYSRQFNTIELNTLFYGVPAATTIQRWADAVGPGFCFCPKFPESISHTLQLSNASRETSEFVAALKGFGDKLGPSFLQLSDRFGPDQAGLLQHYVGQLPTDLAACVELRAEDWFRTPARDDGSAGADPSDGPGANGRFDPAIRDTFQAMLERGVGTVITDVAGRRDVLHMRLTAPVAFIRFVTNRLHPTDYQRADAWVERIGFWAGKGLREVYIFVHSPEELTSPEIMRYLITRFNERGLASLKVPNLENGGQPGNLSLF
ncbi:MAG TPA: DUF72 domain-containing protein [Puia sp.]|jgi:uncharacterized protein YecE (DUF72 family)|nr:DUF72 domain-containing protein [Puia sp.]